MLAIGNFAPLSCFLAISLFRAIGEMIREKLDPSDRRLELYGRSEGYNQQLKALVTQDLVAKLMRERTSNRTFFVGLDLVIYVIFLCFPDNLYCVPNFVNGKATAVTLSWTCIHHGNTFRKWKALQRHMQSQHAVKIEKFRFPFEIGKDEIRGLESTKSCLVFVFLGHRTIDYLIFNTTRMNYYVMLLQRLENQVWSGNPGPKRVCAID